MNRSQIKATAKEKIKGNLWNILWPMLVIAVLFGIVDGFFGPKYSIDMNTMKIVSVQGNSVIVVLLSIVEAIVTAGYLKYIVNFVRTGEFNANVIIETVKEKWVALLIADILVGVIVAACTCLLVIPGIIMGLAYAMVTYLIIDTDIAGQDALKKSREMMNGHKWEFFVFGLSFIGWILLVPFTLGLLLIWLVPYMTVATTLYYENLKKVTK